MMTYEEAHKQFCDAGRELQKARDESDRCKVAAIEAVEKAKAAQKEYERVVHIEREANSKFVATLTQKNGARAAAHRAANDALKNAGKTT